MEDTTWAPNGFFDNLDKFSTAVGYQNLGIAFEFAMMSWPSEQDRDNFIVSITGKDASVPEYNYIKRKF